MSMSPFQRHRQAILASLAASTADPHGTVTGSAYDLMRSQLAENKRALKQIQSIERKAAYKAQVLPVYDSWIDGSLTAGKGAQDEVLTTCLVWHIDAGNYARALQIAGYAVAHGLEAPDQYDRTLPVIVIDEFATAALAGKLGDLDAVPVLVEVAQLTDEMDAPDEARAKLYKAIGYGYIGRLSTAEVDTYELSVDMATQALPYLKRALELYAQVGCKKDIERLERRLKRADEEASKQSPDPAPEAAQAEAKDVSPTATDA